MGISLWDLSVAEKIKIRADFYQKYFAQRLKKQGCGNLNFEFLEGAQNFLFCSYVTLTDKTKNCWIQNFGGKFKKCGQILFSKTLWNQFFVLAIR